MPIVHPATYAPRSRRRKKRHVPLVLVCLLVLFASINYLRPLPATVTTLHLPPVPAVARPNLAWPGIGQAAVGAAGYGILAASGNQDELATASTAKIITALCVLQKQPLEPDQSGPTYTIGPADVSIYNEYVQQNGSVVPVQQGEQLTEYQALEALMVPSANNIADSLVGWVFGSQAAYADYARHFLQQHNLTHTHIGVDASGFDPSTTSNAADLTQLGLLALQNPALLRIADQKQVDLPVVGTVTNYNTVLGENGITGLKTGNNDTDTGAFVFTASYRLGDKDLDLTGAVMGAADLDSALHAASNLVASVEQGFTQATIAKAGQSVGSVQAAWGASTPVVATHALQIVRWQGTPVTTTSQLQADTGNGIVGSVKATSGQVTAETTVQLGHQLSGPSFWWRLTRF